MKILLYLPLTLSFSLIYASEDVVMAMIQKFQGSRNINPKTIIIPAISQPAQPVDTPAQQEARRNEKMRVELLLQEFATKLAALNLAITQHGWGNWDQLARLQSEKSALLREYREKTRMIYFDLDVHWRELPTAAQRRTTLIQLLQNHKRQYNDTDAQRKKLDSNDQNYWRQRQALQELDYSILRALQTLLGFSMVPDLRTLNIEEFVSHLAI